MEEAGKRIAVKLIWCLSIGACRPLVLTDGSGMIVDQETKMKLCALSKTLGMTKKSRLLGSGGRRGKKDYSFGG